MLGLVCAFAACTSPSAACPPGTTKIAGECKPTCASNMDCTAAEVCDPAQKICVAAPSTDAGPARDAQPDAAVGMDAGGRDAEPPPDTGPARDAEPGFTGTTAGQTGGGGSATSRSHRIRLSIGGPQPYGEASTPMHKIRIGPGVTR